MAFHWNQVTWSWLKPMPTREGKSEKPVGGGTVQSGTSGNRRHPFLPCEKPADRMLKVLHQNYLFLITPTEGTPLCMIVHAK